MQLEKVFIKYSRNGKWGQAMLLQYLPQLIMLTAGAVTCIITLVKRFEVLTSLEILLGVLIGFYIVGLIAQKIITKTIEDGEAQKAEQEREMENIETGKDSEAEEASEGTVTTLEE